MGCFQLLRVSKIAPAHSCRLMCVGTKMTPVLVSFSTFTGVKNSTRIPSVVSCTMGTKNDTHTSAVSRSIAGVKNHTHITSVVSYTVGVKNDTRLLSDRQLRGC